MVDTLRLSDPAIETLKGKNECFSMKNKKKLWWLALLIGIMVLGVGLYTNLNIIDPPLYDEYPQDSRKNELMLYSNGSSLILDNSSISPFVDNPIDRAFSRMVDKRGDELKDNVTFSYLHALKWYEEYQSLLGLGNVITSETRGTHIYSNKMKETAFAYAEKWGGSNKPEIVFAEVARYYKMLTYELLSHSNETIMQTNEKELYQFLCEVNYTEYVPDDYRDGYILEYSRDEHSPMLICADLRDKNIYLAFAPPFGAVLSVNDTPYFLAWPNARLTQKLILPQLFLYDYDSDDTAELAVILFVGSGTGAFVTELHIVDIYDDMSEISITNETIEQLLYHRLSANYNPVTETIAVKLDNQTVDVDTSQIDKEMGKSFRGLDLRSIIQFSEENGSLKVHLTIGLNGVGWAIAFDYVDFYAEIIPDEEGNISLSNCYIK